MKKPLSLLLVFAMILAMLPGTALAAGEQTLSSLLESTYDNGVYVINSDVDIVVDESIDLTSPIQIAEGKTVTLDLNGKTISQEKACTGTYCMILNKGKLTIDDNSAEKNGKISFADTTKYNKDNGYASNTIRNEGVLIVNGGTIENTSSDNVKQYGYPHAIDVYPGSETNITGGTVKSANYDCIRMFCNSTTKATTVNISGGNIINRVTFQNPDDNFNTPGYGILNITGGTFTTTDGVTSNVRLLNFSTDWSNMKATISNGTFDKGIKISDYDKDNSTTPAMSDWLTVTGGTFSDITNAIKCAADGATIKLADDTTLAEAFAVDGKSLTIDLNNFTLYPTTNYNVICHDATLTVKNGTIDISNVDIEGKSDRGIFAVGGAVSGHATSGHMVLTDVDVTGKNFSTGDNGGVFMLYQGGEEFGNSSVSITGGSIDLDTNATNGAVFYGGGSTCETVLNITGTTMTIKDVPRTILYNTATLKNCDITISAGDSGFDNGFNEVKLTVDNSKVNISGGTGRALTINSHAYPVYIKNGSVLTFSDMGEGEIRFKGAADLSIDATSTLNTCDIGECVEGATINGTLVTAEQKVGVYPVTFNSNSGTINAGNVVSYAYGTEVSLPTDVTRANYTFGGWYDNAELTGDAITAITATDEGAKTFYAKWVPVQHTITWIVDGKEETTTVAHGETPVYPNGTPTKAADEQYTYTFDKWDTTPVAATGNATYTAVFTSSAIPKYTVTMNGQGAETAGGWGSYTEGANVTISAGGAATGYVFDKWTSADGVTFTDATSATTTFVMPAKNVTVTATWKALPRFSVTFKDGDSVIDTKDYLEGETIVAPADPTKPGYTFNGWNGYTEGMTVGKAHLTFTAQWTENSAPAPDPDPIVPDPTPVDPTPSTPVTPPVEVPEVPEVNDTTIDTSAPTVSTETKEEADGSTTTTATKSETTEDAEGNKTTTSTTNNTTTAADGSTVTEQKQESKVEAADGSVTTTVTENVTTTDTTGATKTEQKQESKVEAADGSVTTTVTNNTTTTDASGATVTEQKHEEKVEAADGSVTTTTVENTTSTDAEGNTAVQSKVEEKVETETATVTTTTTTTADAKGNTEKTEAKEETVVNEDGTTTTTSSSITETAHANGSTGTTVVDTEGNVTADVTISDKAVADAAEAGETVTLPMPAVQSSATTDTAPVINVTTAATETVSVEIPVAEAKPGTVVVLVHEDGTEEVVTKTVQTENGLAVKVEGNVTVKVVDNAKDFHDTDDHWAADAIDHATSRELFDGMGAGQFQPDTTMNRAMLATVLWRMEGKQEAAAESDFHDVEDGHWSEEAVHWAAENEIIKGSNGAFNGNDAVTREQMVTMLYRMSGSPEVAAEDAVEGASDWAADAVAWAVKIGLMKGSNGDLDLQGSATRAQIATFLQRFMKLAF